MKTVYLAGLISTDFPESLQWRITAADELRKAGFSVLTPMRGKEQLALHTKDGGVTDPSRTSRDIILRDYHDVLDCDVILAHLETFGSPRPLMGTICELSWAWANHKPVVAVAVEDNRLMRKHPFIEAAVSHYCPSLFAALEFVVHEYR